jgi:glyoxylase-like metal-dependent hydrolase (beta-lactamase superfamily II)
VDKQYTRNRLFVCLVSASVAAATSLSVAQQSPSAALKVHRLTSNVYWVEGGGGNSGVIIGNRGVIVIDAKAKPEDGKQLLKLIAQLTPKPITMVILTHSDDDHVGGLVSFPKGVPIVAHENNQKELETDPTNHGHGYLPFEDFPNLVVTRNKEHLEIDGIKLELLHWGPAHTSGDLIVYLPSQKIIFTGDILSADSYRPVLHHDKSSSSEGWIASVKGITALDAEQFVPGHGDLLDKQAVENKLNDAATERARIVELLSEGKSLEEIEAAVGDPPPGKTNSRSIFSEAVYRELTQKRP